MKKNHENQKETFCFARFLNLIHDGLKVALKERKKKKRKNKK